MIKPFVVIVTAIIVAGSTTVASVADIAAGAAIVKRACSACHVPYTWKGKSPRQIEALIRNIMVGKAPHPKKIMLTDAQVADVAAYWANIANK